MAIAHSIPCNKPEIHYLCLNVFNSNHLNGPESKKKNKKISKQFLLAIGFSKTNTGNYRCSFKKLTKSLLLIIFPFHVYLTVSGTALSKKPQTQ